MDSMWVNPDIGVVAHVEMTDLFCGEANYTWVERIDVAILDHQSRLATVRRIKAALGVSGRPMRTTDYGDGLEMRDADRVVFVTYERCDQRREA